MLSQEDGGDQCALEDERSVCVAVVPSVLCAVQDALHHTDATLVLAVLQNGLLLEEVKGQLDSDCRLHVLAVDAAGSGLRRKMVQLIKGADSRKREPKLEAETMSVGSLSADMSEEPDDPLHQSPQEPKGGEVDFDSASISGAEQEGKKLGRQQRTLVLDSNVCPGSTGGFRLEWLPAAGAFEGVTGKYEPFSVVIPYTVQRELLSAGPLKTGEVAPCRARLLSLEASPPPGVSLAPAPLTPLPGSGDTAILNEIRRMVTADFAKRHVLATKDQIFFLRFSLLSDQMTCVSPLLIYAPGHLCGVALDLSDAVRRRDEWAEAVWTA